ncbi:pleiotropic drug resistance protein 3 [Phtheirospermum japonicum]|uniref:Pleiotropic drug resistance protein 3 n=1 Tax=Phtheirospermum japonicum TaxID=374723 RepID=A0A830B6H5_9LAMI|nr:pleiotropic drug resistance protein 3 [Phtheirospermum japonicum]
MTVREKLDFSSHCQGIGSRAEIMAEVIRKEREAKLVPDPDVDTYMKALNMEQPYSKDEIDDVRRRWTECLLEGVLENCFCTSASNRARRIDRQSLKTLFGHTGTHDVSGLHLEELDEIRNDAYENAKIYKRKVKLQHDKKLITKYFKADMQVWLYNSCLHLFPRNLKSRWSVPFLIEDVMLYGVVKLFNEKTQEHSQVKGHRVKAYFQVSKQTQDMESDIFEDPPIT